MLTQPDDLSNITKEIPNFFLYRDLDVSKHETVLLSDAQVRNLDYGTKIMGMGNLQEHGPFYEIPVIGIVKMAHYMSPEESPVFMLNAGGRVLWTFSSFRSAGNMAPLVIQCWLHSIENLRCNASETEQPPIAL